MAWYVGTVRQDSASRDPNQPRTINTWLITMLVIALAVRLAWVLHLPVDAASIEQLPDQREYLELGRNLLHGKGLNFIDVRFNETILAYRTPGYPIFVALCGGDIRIIRVVQAFIDAFGVLAVFFLARRWMGLGVSVLSAGIIAINPFFIYFGGLILSETLFAAMLIWGMALLVMRRPAAWWGGVILLACSILVRPSAIALPVLLGIAAAFVNHGSRKPYDSRWVPPVGTVMVLVTLIVLTPWAWRNQRVLGSWIWTTTNSGITLYDGLNSDATGASDQTFVRDMPQLRSMGEVGRSEYLSDLAWQFVREHPARAAQLALIKIARTWSPLPLSKEYGTNPKLVAVALGYMIPLYLLILLGLRFGKATRSAKVLLVLPALYFTIAHAVSVGSMRYRIPADVPMAVVAGFGIHAAIARRRTGSGLSELQLMGCKP